MSSTVTDPRRLAVLRATGLLDTAAEEAFDRLTRLAVRLVRVPAAFVSLVDAERDFYKSACGFGEPLASARELTGLTFCHYTVERTTPLVIPDTAADPVYRDVPTVRTLGVAAYVGVPLVVDGATVGAFCAIDVRPRAWTDDDVEILRELAASAQREIELRLAVETVAARGAALEEARRHAETTQRVAEAANAAKSQFLANMSHELRTPLNAIGGYTQLVQMGVHGPVTPGQVDALERVQTAQRRLLGIINDILNYAKLEGGHVEYDVRTVDLRDVVADVTPLVEPQLAAKGLTLDVRLPPDPCLVLADPEKLGQVLINLLSNATKFTDARHPATGTAGQVSIDVVTRPDAGAAVVFLRVRDTGRGIHRGKQAAVFEPFVQVDATYARTGDGTGLGLAISRDLARGMGGDLRVRSTVGAGSAFTITLRRADEADD